MRGLERFGRVLLPLAAGVGLALAAGTQTVRVGVGDLIDQVMGSEKVDQNFSPLELQKIRAAIERAKSKFPLGKFGPGQLPILKNYNGEIKFDRIKDNITEGWDCKVVSAFLALELMNEGFDASVQFGEDVLQLWGMHSWTCVRKNGKMFFVDLTPPYRSKFGDISKDCPHTARNTVPPHVVRNVIEKPSSDWLPAREYLFSTGYVEKNGKGYLIYAMIMDTGGECNQIVFYVSEIDLDDDFERGCSTVLGPTPNRHAYNIGNQGYVYSDRWDDKLFLDKNPDVISKIREDADRI